MAASMSGNHLERMGGMTYFKASTLALALALAGCVAPSGTGQSSRSARVDPNAVLPPQSLLRDDTIEALTHNRGQSRLGYVGVWAVNADACAMMDQTAFDGFAVLTPESLRQNGETCAFAPGALGQSRLEFFGPLSGPFLIDLEQALSRLILLLRRR